MAGDTPASGCRPSEKNWLRARSIARSPMAGAIATFCFASMSPPGHRAGSHPAGGLLSISSFDSKRST